LGLAFKAGTGDTRESPSRAVVLRLLDAGVESVRVHDPSPFAREEFKKEFPASDRLFYCERVGDALDGAGACIILTEWPEYKRLRPADLAAMAPRPLVVDARRVLPVHEFKEAGVELVRLGESESRSFVP
ncbi:MAG: UDP-glucose 6-dehydrogenase, partial [Candidatus Lokiarchaeota archaeon]|nr:UDP-glucose 6-dehydrogenase [Candidatus Lokiarchaeota archaeon]